MPQQIRPKGFARPGPKRKFNDFKHRRQSVLDSLRYELKFRVRPRKLVIADLRLDLKMLDYFVAKGWD